MKQITSLFAIFALFATSCIIAQADDTATSPTSQGKILLGGNSSFSFTSTKSEIKSDDPINEFEFGTNSRFSFAPAAGYFIIDNLVLGISLNYASSKFKPEEGRGLGESKSNTIAVLPFVKYYFAQDKIRPFLQLSAGIGSSTAEETFFDLGNFDPFIQSREVKSSLFAYGIDGGVAFFLNDFVSIDLGVGYAKTSFKRKDDNPDNDRSVNSGLGFTAGFNIFL